MQSDLKLDISDDDITSITSITSQEIKNVVNNKIGTDNIVNLDTTTSYDTTLEDIKNNINSDIGIELTSSTKDSITNFVGDLTTESTIQTGVGNTINTTYTDTVNNLQTNIKNSYNDELGIEIELNENVDVYNSNAEEVLDTIVTVEKIGGFKSIKQNILSDTINKLQLGDTETIVELENKMKTSDTVFEEFTDTTSSEFTKKIKNFLQELFILFPSYEEDPVIFKNYFTESFHTLIQNRCIFNISFLKEMYIDDYLYEWKQKIKRVYGYENKELIPVIEIPKEISMTNFEKKSLQKPIFHFLILFYTTSCFQ